ncbi:unnamed protein product [Callosobruchus maculatus]|uniref:Uncharacterized protein n=1 Tax=Callosobruchus maculatus TaxID=64391 RepID=A0A653BXH1_CALMS|nr:unnamed protein product [Callosobruchus maculatus]
MKSIPNTHQSGEKYQWTFAGRPIIDSNSPSADQTFEVMKNKIIRDLNTNITQFFVTMVPQTSSGLSQNMNFEYLIETFLSDIFKNYLQHPS